MKMSCIIVLIPAFIIGFFNFYGCSENYGAVISEPHSPEFARGEFQSPIRSTMVNSSGKLLFASNAENNYQIYEIDLTTSELKTFLDRQTLIALGIDLVNPATQLVIMGHENGLSIFDMLGRSSYFFDSEANLIHTVTDSLGVVGSGSRLFSIDQNSFIGVNQSSRQEYLFEEFSATTSFYRGTSFFPFESYQDLEAVKNNFMLKANPVFAQTADQKRQFVAYQFSSWIFTRDVGTGHKNIISEPFDKNFPQIAPLHMDDGSIAFDPSNAIQYTSHILDMTASDHHLFVVYSGKTMNQQGRLFFSGLDNDKVFDLVENTGDSILVYDLDGNFMLQKELGYRVYSITSKNDNLCMIAFDDDYVVYCLDINSLVEVKVE